MSVTIGDSFPFFLELLSWAFTGEQQFNCEPKVTVRYTKFVS